jgi:hypothetical protein
MVLTAQIEAVSHSFHVYTTIEWCLIAKSLEEVGVVSVVIETCVRGAVSQYTAALYVLW